MRKLLIILIIGLLPFIAFADVDTFSGVEAIDTWDGQTAIDTIDGQTVASGGSCVSPSCPATCSMTATEGFEGGSNVCWTTGTAECVNVWANSGGTWSLISSPGSPSEGDDCSKSLQVVMTSATAAANTFDTGGTIDVSAQSVDLVAYWYPSAVTIAAYGYYSILDGNASADGSGNTPGSIYLTNRDGEWAIYGTGSGNSAFIVIDADSTLTPAWFLLTLHIDTTAANSYISIAGDTACSGGSEDTATCKKFTSNDNDFRYMVLGPAMGAGDGEDGTHVYGYAYISEP